MVIKVNPRTRTADAMFMAQMKPWDMVAQAQRRPSAAEQLAIGHEMLANASRSRQALDLQREAMARADMRFIMGQQMETQRAREQSRAAAKLAEQKHKWAMEELLAKKDADLAVLREQQSFEADQKRRQRAFELAKQVYEDFYARRQAQQKSAAYDKTMTRTAIINTLGGVLSQMLKKTSVNPVIVEKMRQMSTEIQDVQAGMMPDEAVFARLRELEPGWRPDPNLSVSPAQQARQRLARDLSFLLDMEAS
ncbi:MAG: hypothetical protein GXP62_04015, partial [Oligoflexia bacterium]|nr:hypothetical protein [Oligoflexia bacterium]